MLSRVHSFVLRGIDAIPCEIEVDLGLAHTGSTKVVGLPDRAVRESTQRVEAAICNGGYRIPRSRVLVNLAPATVPKEGAVYELPIALAMLLAAGVVDRAPGSPSPDGFLIAGELALDGRLRPVKGVISLAQLAREQGRSVLVPAANAVEAAVVEGVETWGASSLQEVVALFNGSRDEANRPRLHPPVDIEALLAGAEPEIDFADVRGQEAGKRALTIAAAGSHNVVMIGPAGGGKTMMAKALPGILPALTRDEAVEVTRIYSSAGQLPPGRPLQARRPVRAPHHDASAAAIIGGGSVPRPGEVSLAHRGVLFLDEMPEFARHVLETLRQPLEDGCVTVARAQGAARFPARFMLVGALNPTPKGEMARDETSRRAMQRYLAKLSGPLIDRIDIHVEVPTVAYRQLRGAARGTDTATMRDAVAAARRRQRDRQGAPANAELSGRVLDRVAPLDEAGSLVLGQAMTELGLSARAYDKVRRVARTIADLEGAASVESHHVAEAVQYRLLDRL